MLCNYCGSENTADSRFCAHCGAETMQQPAHPGKACPSCQHDNKPGAKFCEQCGAELRNHHQKHSQHQQVQSSKREKGGKRIKHVDTKLHWHPGLVGIMIIGGVAILIYVVTPRSNVEPFATSQVVETKSPDPALEARAMGIAAKFVCSCGTCGEKPLDVCTCPTAIQERQFIRNYLQMGRQPSEVIVALNTSFGWIKPEFASLVGDSTKTGRSSLPALSLSQPSVPGVLEQKAAAMPRNQAVAKAADRLEILARFKCACGQCGIDELKDCNCSHPRGAKEVKTFVDERIREGTYTVAQIIDIVDATYGGKKH
jgi:cytochrome c-type biogenesis protein CcmH/NrfF